MLDVLGFCYSLAVATYVLCSGTSGAMWIEKKRGGGGYHKQIAWAEMLASIQKSSDIKGNYTIARHTVLGRIRGGWALLGDFTSQFNIFFGSHPQLACQQM